jgi:hypothetical protein
MVRVLDLQPTRTGGSGTTRQHSCSTALTKSSQAERYSMHQEPHPVTVRRKQPPSP